MKKSSTRLIILIATLALVAAACGGGTVATTVPDSSTTGPDTPTTGPDTPTPAPDTPTPDPIKLAGTRWVGTKLFLGGAEVPLVPNAAPTIDFEGNGRSAAGTTGCNSWFGDVVLGAGTITFGGLGQTEMACEEPLMLQERNVITVLQSASFFTMGDGTLTVGQVGGSVLEFIDRAAAFPDSELTGTQWIADTRIVGRAASTLVPDTTVTLFIDAAAGVARGSTGCNEYGGTVEWSDTQLTFGRVEATEKGCLGAGIMEQEAFVLSVLQGELEVTIDGDRLTLTTPNGDGLSFRAAS